MNDITLSSEYIEIYKRHLPHWRSSHVLYFITWRLNIDTEPLSTDERTIVGQALEYFHAKRYWLLAYVIMDDHLHVIVRLNHDLKLENTVHTWKSYTVNQLQRQYSRKGSVWQQEYFDRIIRDGEELEIKLRYVAYNPVKRWPDATEYQWLRFFDP